MFDASDYSVECKEVDNWLWWKELERVESRPPRALLSIPVLRFLMDQPQDRMLPAGEANHSSLHYSYILDEHSHAKWGCY
ncbi:hypothetical protein N7455_005180 [Penicillium solitum]|uniref:uncharacterized protein n=1 Tax=Penicillium solitum TaxID=60172 RepID=UPI0032C41D17|nr:hypothetical protein N7455_005180 [Penicillium solitum]